MKYRSWIYSCNWLRSSIEFQSSRINQLELNNWFLIMKSSTKRNRDSINLFLPIFSKHSQEYNSIYGFDSKFNFILTTRKSIKMFNSHVDVSYLSLSLTFHSILWILFTQHYWWLTWEFHRNWSFLQCLQKKILRWERKQKNLAFNPTYLKNGISVTIKMFHSFYHSILFNINLMS